MSENKPEPMFPDAIQPYRKDCWCCGKPGVVVVSTLYKCEECGVGWNNRYGVTEQLEQANKKLRDQIMSNQIKIPLVDFTQPDAPSAPA